MTPLSRGLALTALVALALVLVFAGCRGGGPRDTPPDDRPSETTSGPGARVPRDTRPWPEIALEKRWEGFDQPLYLTHAGDGSGRLYVAEKGGRIRVIEDGRPLDEPLLDISDLISEGAEQGLLGLAFAPDFSRSGRFYVDYTDDSGDTVIARYRASGRTGSVREDVVLTVDQPFPNHNGGQLEFGRDGYLYVGLGDGGSAGDPRGNAQDPRSLLGKILRIDVSGAKGYTVPEDNPFAGTPGARGEVWDLGLRNPWRFSFDGKTGELYIADVGQDAWEEIDVEPPDSGGYNYGWNRYEGSHPFGDGPRGPGRSAWPAVEYNHSVGQSVTGGYVWRVDPASRLDGVYLYADYVSGAVRGLRRDSGFWRTRTLLDTGLGISSFGVDEDGRVYVLDLTGGGIHEVVPK